MSRRIVAGYEQALAFLAMGAGAAGVGAGDQVPGQRPRWAGRIELAGGTGADEDSPAQAGLWL